MEYTIYKLKFLNGVHYGINSLENTKYTFLADTLFSALCIEAIKRGQQYLDELVYYVKSGQLLFSDAFPYIQDEYYLPKPMLHIENDFQGDSIIKKAYKKMNFVPLTGFEEYLKGTLAIEKAYDLTKFGFTDSRVSASVRGEEETMPYRIGIYYYKEGCGLYLLVKWEKGKILELFEELLEGVSYSGIGGKKSAGLGRFEFYKVKTLPQQLRNRINKEKGKFMTLSVSLPTEQELDAVIEHGSYLLEKRSGFVDSSNYALQQRRKKDLYVFQAGSCFTDKFEGDVYDVASGGGHPVYKYAKPLFMEVTP